MNLDCKKVPLCVARFGCYRNLKMVKNNSDNNDYVGDDNDVTVGCNLNAGDDYDDDN